jgi:Fe2+ or Zn2+ uptake regulation protein
VQRITRSAARQGGGALDRLVADRLAASGVRYTSGRRLVVKALRRAPGPQSAAELHRRLRGRVPLSSLYRTLTVLEATGVLAPHHGARDVTRYELAEWLSGHHHHLVCDVCGRVEDVEVDGVREQILETIAGQVIGDTGFTATGHTLEIEGLCAACGT